MKNIATNLLLVLFSAVFFCACDSGEVNANYEGYFLNVFDVKKSYIYPAFSDTSYYIKDISAGDGEQTLANGDRAYMSVNYYYDIYTMTAPSLSIGNVITKITRRSMRAKSDFKPENYNSPFYSAETVTFYDLSGETHETTYLWADEETQNIAVRYADNLYCEPLMTVDSLRDGCLYFRLYANLQERDWTDNETYAYDDLRGYNCKILSFDMDWDMIYSELTEAEKNDIQNCDSLASNIAFVYRNCSKNSEGLYIPVKAFTNVKFSNPLYKK